MFEVLLGYITNLTDIINYIIDAIQSIFSTGEDEKKDDAGSDEEALKQKSMF